MYWNCSFEIGVHTMRRLLILATLLLPLSILAQSSGAKKEIDGQKFTYDGGTWVHDALDSSTKAEKAFSVVYRDKTWQKWYAEGSSTLKQILDLGSKVRFKYKGPDGAYHTYGVFESKAALKAGAVVVAGAAAGGAAGGAAAGGAAAAAAGGGAAAAAGGMALGTQVLIGAGAIVAGAVVVDAVDDENSPNKR